jgi:hypothetical protein
MNPVLKSVLWWLFAIIFTIVIAAYQRITGPTYPVSGKVTMKGQEIKYKLIRTADNDEDALISIEVPDTSISGILEYKRFKSFDSLTTMPMVRKGTKLECALPKQPAAGKIEYKLYLASGGEKVQLSNEQVVMRFKGTVPVWVLLPHILFMFLAMLFSTRAGIEALIKGRQTYLYAMLTLIFLIPGGLLLGPVVQKYAFGAYWTGWPFGHDLTDNKTALAFIAWLIAVIKLRKNREARGWAIAAALVLLLVYLVPHSVLGSEIDHTQMPK